MKGIVFTEFLELVSREFGEEMTDHIIEASDLPSGAAYTAVGTYDHAEMITMVEKLSEATHRSVPDLLTAFGEHLLTRFATRYPQFFVGINSSFEFLERIEAHIHVEVRKLYPDAELPSIECRQRSVGVLELIYRSTRPLAAFAEGLMRGVIAYYDENIEVTRVVSADSGKYVRFELKRS